MSAPANIFDTVAGLPAHPLLVHAAVVLFPLGLLTTIAVVLVPRLRRHYGWPAIVLLAVGGLFVLVSKESGEQLARHVGTPAAHAGYADVLMAVAGVTCVTGLLWWLLELRHVAAARRYEQAQRAELLTRAQARSLSRSAARSRGRAAGRGGSGATAAADGTAPLARPLLHHLLGALLAALAAASLVLVVAVGHTGAQSAWEDVVTATPATSSPSASAGGSASGSPTATEATYTLAQVGEHADRSSCWAAIEGSVYDLTSWIANHPGGQDAIVGLCGTDATAKFTAQHAGAARPAARLATMRLGSLAG